MIRGSKINYKDFIHYINSVHLKDFLKTFRAPILMGRQVSAGDIREATLHDYNQTFLFQETSTTQNKSQSIQKMMYLLRIVGEEGLNSQRFSIGRDASNDIVIVDYTISKKHAEIRYEESSYLIRDFGSRNGTQVNAAPIAAHKKYKIKERDILSFGRLSFVLLRPISLYISYRIYQKRVDSLRGDFREYARSVSLLDIRKLAKKHGILTSERSKEDLIALLLKNISPSTLLWQIVK